MSHDGWVWQGRQYHMWFGHGTKPADAKEEDGPQSLDERIKLLPQTVVASLPAKWRQHSAASFTAADQQMLVSTMRAWVARLDLTPAAFAARFLGYGADSDVSKHLRAAAAAVADTQHASSLWRANNALAAAMTAIGLDRWRAQLKEFASKATSLGSAIPQRYSIQLTMAPAPWDVAAIDFNPLEEPMTPAASRTPGLRAGPRDRDRNAGRLRRPDGSVCRQQAACAVCEENRGDEYTGR